MSPRLASMITSSSRCFASIAKFDNTRKPSGPCCSKNATCGLIPGYGAQGARAEEALSALTADKQEGVYKGGLINASRSITHGKGVQNASTVSEAVAAIKTAIKETIFDLAVIRI